MSNQLQIESYRISMRKLRTFCWKVTEFLNDDKITCLQRLAAFAINGVYWRTEWCGYLCRWIDYLCKICLYYLCFISIFHRHITKLYIAPWLSEACKPVLSLYEELEGVGNFQTIHVFHVYRPTVFSGSRACSATLFFVKATLDILSLHIPDER